MSRLFNRTIEMVITGAGESRTIRDLRISFNTSKSRSSTPNGIQVQVYNPAPDTRNAAQDTKATIEVSAGYDGRNILLSRAEIDSAIIDRTPPDVTMDISAQEGIRTLRETTISISHASGSPVQTVLDEIVAAMGLPVRPIEADLSVPLRGGFAHVGKPASALDALVRRFNGSWSIQNGEIQILGPEGYQSGNQAVLLSPDSGMIDSPVPLEKQTSSEKQSNDARIGYRVKSLLRPDVEPGSLVEIRSFDVNGFFAVDEIDHSGDTHGQEWYSTLTCYEIEQ